MPTPRLLAIIFSAACAAILIGLIGLVVRGIPLVTDLSVVLPESGDSQVEARIAKQLSASFGQKTVIAIFGEDEASLDAAVDLILSKINDSELIVLDPLPSDFVESALDPLIGHRFGLLDPGDAVAIAESDYSQLDARLNRYLHGFPTSIQWLPFAADPYNLFGRFVESAIQVPDVSVYDDYIVAHPSGQDVYLIRVKPVDGRSGIDSQPAVLAAFDEIRAVAAALPDIQVVMSGAFFHIADATQKSKLEVLIISTASILLIILIFVVTFRAFAPLLFAISSIVFGFLAAVAVTGNLFGEIHMLTLVFGTSLIGLSIDYAFHFLCMGMPGTLSHLRKSSFIALVSTVVAYGMLTGSAISVVDQIAIFAMTGLAACWLFVVVIYTLFHQIFPLTDISVRSRIIEHIGHAMQHLWDRGNRTLFLSLLAVMVPLAAIAVISQGKVTESLASLYVPNEALHENDRRVADAFGQYSPNQFFTVEGDSIQEVVGRMESLAPTLMQLRNAGAISGYQLLSDLMPSLARQARNYGLLKRLYGDDGHVYQTVDLAPGAVAELKQMVRSGGGQLIDDALFIQLASGSFPHLWLGRMDEQFIAIVALQGVQELHLLYAAEVPTGVRFVNLVDRWAGALESELLRSAWILLATILAIALGLVIWLRSWSGVLIALIPASAALMVIGGLSIAGQEISLFHLFGLYLIIGLGLDYGIFIFRNQHDDARCFVAIFLSAVTTVFAFGLLSQSSTPMISAFGVTIFFGTVLNILLAPGLRLFATRRDGA